MKKLLKTLLVVFTLIVCIFTTGCFDSLGGFDISCRQQPDYEDSYYDGDDWENGDNENTEDGGNENDGDNNGNGNNNGGSTGGDNSGSTGGDNSGSTGGDNSGSTGGDNSGSTGGNNSGSTGGDNSGSTGGDNSGSTGGDNSGSTGGDNSGSTGDDNSGSTGGDNSGSTGGDNSGSTGGDNSGSTGGDNSGSTGGDNSGSTGGTTTPPIDDITTISFAEKTNRFLDGAKIDDTAFINYYKNLGVYNANAPVTSNAIYASPNGNGNGTKNKPYSLQDALDNVSVGQTLYLLAGTYTADSADGFYVETTGTQNAYITIRNYPGAKVVITNNNSGNESYGLQIGNCAYTVIEGIEISNISAYNAYAIAVWGDGQNHLIFRNLEIYNIKTTSSNPESESDSSANALLISGETNSAVSNVIVANCNMYNNVTGWAETLSITGNCEYVYILENNVHDNTNIGIDFYGNAGYCSTPSLDQPRYSVASGNYISNSQCGYADCAGLYVDGARDIILQYNTITRSNFGIEIGSEEKQESYPVQNIIVRNNLIYDNLKVGIRVGGYEEVETGVVQSTLFANNTLINNGEEIVIAKVNGIQFVNNIIKAKQGEVVIKTDFSTSYCKNITFTNNYISVANTSTSQYKFEMFNSTQTGITAFQNKTGATVITGNLTLDSKYIPSADSVVINAGASTNYGNYDYLLRPRLNGAVDLGALERH